MTAALVGSPTAAPVQPQTLLLPLYVADALTVAVAGREHAQPDDARS